MPSQLNDEIMKYELAYLYEYTIFKGLYIMHNFLSEIFHINSQEDFSDLNRIIKEIFEKITTILKDKVSIKGLREAYIYLVIEDNIIDNLVKSLRGVQEIEKGLLMQREGEEIIGDLEEFIKQIIYEIGTLLGAIVSKLYDTLSLAFSPINYIIVMNPLNKSDVLIYSKLYDYIVKSRTIDDLFIEKTDYEISDQVSSERIMIRISHDYSSVCGIPSNLLNLIAEMATRDSTGREIIKVRVEDFVRSVINLDRDDVDGILRILSELRQLMDDEEKQNEFLTRLQQGETYTFLKECTHIDNVTERALASLSSLLELLYKVLRYGVDNKKLRLDIYFPKYMLNLVNSHMLTSYLYVNSFLSGFLPLSHIYIKMIKISIGNEVLIRELEDIGELDLFILGIMPSEAHLRFYQPYAHIVSFEPFIMFVETTQSSLSKYVNEKKHKIAKLGEILDRINEEIYESGYMSYPIKLIIAGIKDATIPSESPYISYIDIREMLDLRGFRRTIFKVLTEENRSLKHIWPPILTQAES